MPEYVYQAVDPRGVVQSGRLNAPDSHGATQALRAQGLYPTLVNAVDPAETGHAGAAGSGRFTGIRRWSRRQAKPRELAMFTRQLATLTKAGMPLVRGLEVLARQERNSGLQRIITEVVVVIKSGGSLSDGLAQHPREFDRLYLAMIKAGEAAGALEAVLERLARLQEKSEQLRGRIATALVYPVIVLAVAAAILGGLLVFVVPKFKLIFADLLKGAPLPALTQAVLAASDAVKTHALLLGGLALAGGLALKGWRRTARGMRIADSLTVRTPLVGELILKGVVARFSRTLGTLLAGGVPILPALLIARDTCDNSRVAAAIASIHDRVKEGAPLARPLEETGAFPPLVASLIDVGEHTGQLAEMLGKVAEIYEDEVDNAVAGLSALLEPLLIVFLAVVVGTIVIALFLPIVRIVQLMT